MTHNCLPKQYRLLNYTAQPCSNGEKLNCIYKYQFGNQINHEQNSDFRFTRSKINERKRCVKRRKQKPKTYRQEGEGKKGGGEGGRSKEPTSRRGRAQPASTTSSDQSPWPPPPELEHTTGKRGVADRRRQGFIGLAVRIVHKIPIDLGSYTIVHKRAR